MRTLLQISLALSIWGLVFLFIGWLFNFDLTKVKIFLAWTLSSSVLFFILNGLFNDDYY